MYVDKEIVRFIYKIIDDKIVIEVIAISKRDEMQVYEDASSRL